MSKEEDKKNQQEKNGQSFEKKDCTILELAKKQQNYPYLRNLFLTENLRSKHID